MPSKLGEDAVLIGDFNRDGRDDLAIFKRNSGPGKVLVLFGSPDIGKENQISIATAGPDRLVEVVGNFDLDDFAYTGHVGDVNGDGIADLGIVDIPAYDRAPHAYVLFGARTGRRA